MNNLKKGQEKKYIFNKEDFYNALNITIQKNFVKFGKTIFNEKTKAFFELYFEKNGKKIFGKRIACKIEEDLQLLFTINKDRYERCKKGILMDEDEVKTLANPKYEKFCEQVINSKTNFKLFNTIAKSNQKIDSYKVDIRDKNEVYGVKYTKNFIPFNLNADNLSKRKKVVVANIQVNNFLEYLYIIMVVRNVLMLYEYFNNNNIIAKEKKFIIDNKEDKKIIKKYSEFYLLNKFIKKIIY